MDDLVRRLSQPLYDASGEVSDAPEQAIDAIEALQAQLAEARDLLKRTLPALDAAHDTHIIALGRNPDDYDSKFRRAAAAIRAMKGERG